jgi:hypothetical protein
MKTSKKPADVALYPTPEITARENAHVNQMIRREARVRHLVAENGERLLRDVYEDSQLRLEIEDTLKDELREEFEDERRELREELEDERREFRKEFEGEPRKEFEGEPRKEVRKQNPARHFIAAAQELEDDLRKKLARAQAGQRR